MVVTDVAMFHFAARSLKENVIQPLGSESDVDDLSIGLTSIIISGIRKVLYCVKFEKPSELGVPQLSGQVCNATCAKYGAKYKLLPRLGASDPSTFGVDRVVLPLPARPHAL